MDNFRVDVTSNGNILDALKLITRQHSKIKYWKADKDRFLLAWTKPGMSTGWTEAPFEMTYEDIAPVIVGWLKNTADYGREPDHDGDNGKGWRVYNEDWGHVDHDFAVFAAVKPVWAMYGK